MNLHESLRLWDARAEAARQVARSATRQVYGDQQEALQAQIKQQNELIARNERTIAELRSSVVALGQQLSRGAEGGVEKLRVDVAAVRAAVDAVPRQIAHHQK